MSRHKIKDKHKKIIDKFIDSLEVGEFKGDFTLEWIGPDRFQYEPHPLMPFTFIRGNGEEITPEGMETDGGSIPRFAQCLMSTSPWEYGPAYMIHDWEFYRHDFDPNFDKSFEEVNLTLAEALWTLMNKGYNDSDFPPNSKSLVHGVYSGVMTPICRAVWDQK